MQKRKNPPQTSLDAKASLDPTETAKIYAAVIGALSVIGEGTMEEIAAFAKIEKSRIWKRLSEMHEAGMIYRPGNRRLLRSGRTGYTWMLTDKSLPKTKTTERALKGKSVGEYSKKLIQPPVPDLFGGK